jgi:purine-binding chemotaxis protein CheW
MLVGLVVDRVNAVIAVDLKTLQPVPDVGPKWPARSMRSVARWNGAFLYLPDVETLFANRIQDKASQVAVEGAEE